MELSHGLGYLSGCNCSCDSNLRSGSSRDDDTTFPRACCLPPAFSRNRIAGHPFPSTRQYQVGFVVCHLFQKPLQRRIFDFSQSLSSERVSHHIGQLDQVAGVRLPHSRFETGVGIEAAVAMLHGGFKSLLSGLALDFGVTPQHSQSGVRKERIQQFQGEALISGSLLHRYPGVCTQNQSAYSHSRFPPQAQHFQTLRIIFHFVAVKFPVLRPVKSSSQLATTLVPRVRISQSHYAKNARFAGLVGFSRPIAPGVKWIHYLVAALPGAIKFGIKSLFDKDFFNTKRSTACLQA